VVVPAVGRRTRGRGAYLCPQRACFEQALRRRALERALARARRGAASVALGDRGRVRSPELEVLWPSVVAALDHELENLQRTGDIGHSPHYDALRQLRRGLGAPGRSA
jgi:hypothetical protein